MRINKDFFDNPIIPDFVLSKANKERIGVINCIDKTYEKKYRDLDEITFQTMLYNEDNEKNEYYDTIDLMKYVFVKDIGFFSIADIQTESESTEYEKKYVTCKSYECTLGQKYLEEFVINMGDEEEGAIYFVDFYNSSDPSRSLLHLIFSEKAPEWTFGHIDPSLESMRRSFEVTRQDIYDFVMNDVSNAFGCTFVFDTLNMTINVYTDENYGKNTNIYVSYDTLSLKGTNISCSTDNIKTALRLTGADNINVREINFGSDVLYNFDPYNSLEYWSQGLYDAYNAWHILRDEKLQDYNTLLSQYTQYYLDINYLTYEKLPDDPDSTDWTKYGLNPLKEKLSAYEQRQAVLIKAGYGEPSSPYYNNYYLPIYNTINAINQQISVVQATLDSMKQSQTDINNQMVNIETVISMENNFTSEQLAELSSFIREDEFNSDNYIVTDNMTDEEKLDMLYDLLEYGQKELTRVSVPELSFSADLVNLFSIPEFDPFQEDLDVGNYIWVSLRDNFDVKTSILSYHINFFDDSDFSVTFNSIVKKSKNKCLDIAQAIKTANSTSTSLSYNKSTWSQAAKDTDSISQMIENGLAEANMSIKSGIDSDVVMDSRGLLITTRTGDYANRDAILIGGGRIVFTEDGWRTVSEAVGRVTIDGQSVFGVIARAVLAGDIIGSRITGSSIIGTTFNNGNGTFSVDENGNLVASSATITGTINANTGSFGGTNGFKIEAGKFYSNNKSTFASDSQGVYVGNDGIKLGSKFSVDPDGYLFATDAIIDSSSSNRSVRIMYGGLYGYINGQMYGGINATNYGIVLHNQGVTENGIAIAYSETEDGSDFETRFEAKKIHTKIYSPKDSSSSYRSISLTDDRITIYSGNNGLNVYNTIRTGIMVLSQNIEDLNSGIEMGIGNYMDSDAVVISGGFYAYGSLGCSGTKYRVVDTDHYGSIGMNAFETMGAYFSDIGSGIIDESGKCYVFLDEIFKETISLNHDYQIMLTETNGKQVLCEEKSNDYFIVSGDIGAKFDWMIIGKQKGYDADRGENVSVIANENNGEGEEIKW